MYVHDIVYFAQVYSLVPKRNRRLINCTFITFAYLYRLSQSVQVHTKYMKFTVDVYELRQRNGNLMYNTGS